MSHSLFRACLVALLLFLPSLPASGLASLSPALTVLHFDDLTAGVDLIQNQYLGAYGVAFDAGRIIVPDSGTHSGRQALRASGFQAEFHQDPLILYFSGGQSYVSMRVGLVQTTAAPVKAVLRAYDASGAPIGTADTAMLGPGPTPIHTLLEITDAVGIRQVRLHYENTFLFEAIDDLTYNHVETPSPESNAPLVQIWSPSHNGIVLSPHFQLAGTIEEESALADVRLSIGQPGAAATSFQIQVTGGPPVSNIYGLDSGVLYGQLAEGSNIVKVIATDIHGNRGEDAVTVIYERLAPPPATLDLYPTAIEITQGIQDKVAKLYNPPTDAPLNYDGSAIPLVAGKSTVVRLYGTASQTAATVRGVPAELWGYRTESGALLPGSPLQPANGTIPLTPGEGVEAQRARLDGAWIFELPPAWTEAGAIRLLATVNPGQNVEECPTCYNTGNRLNLPYLLFAPMPDLHLYPFWACVRRAPTDPSDRCDMVNPFAPLTLLQSHDSVLPAVLPTANMDLHLPANPIIYMDGDFSLGGNMTSPRVSAFLGALAYRRYQDQVGGVYRCINSVGGQSWIGCFTVAENHLYLGLMPPPVNDTVGLARVDSTAAVSVFDPGFVNNHSAVVAEELSHAIEFGWHAPHTAHPNCTTNLPGWPNAGYPQYVDPTGAPYPRASIGQWGFEPRPPYAATSLFDPAATFDYMSYCNPSWVSPYTYRLLHHTLRTGFTLDHNYHPFQELFPFPATAANAQTEYMLVMGEIDADDTVSLQPFNRFTLPAVEMNDPGTGPYQLQVRSTGGVLFERRFAVETALQGVVDGEPGLFAELVPFPAGAVEIRIVRDGKTLAKRTASLHAPQVQLLTPVGGEEWPAGGKASIRWSGSDADGDTLFYTVQYSLDNGVSWQTVAADLTTTSVDLDLAWLAGADQAHVRVLASDGMHTSIAQTATSFRVANKPPVIAILAPAEGATLAAGQPVTVRGLATDREEGPLPAHRLTWLLDGVEAGQGDTLQLSRLAAGAHQLTLRAADSEGLQATATSTFTLAQPAFAVTFEALAVETVCGGATHTVHVGWRTSGGGGAATVERITVSSDTMDIAAVEGPLASAGETSLQVHLEGGGSATVSIRAADGSGRFATAHQTVAAGHCLAAGLAVDRSPLDFAFVEVGMSQTLTLSLSNVGSEPITVTGADGLAQPFAFASTPTWPLTLQPGAKTAIAVRFTPVTAGVASSLLRIRQGATSVSLPVIGEGRSAPLPPSVLYLPLLRR